MHDTGAPTTTPHALPTAAWAVAWTHVAGQAYALLTRGTQPVENWPLSILVAVALVCFFSYGVLRARMVRFWLVTVLTGVALLFYVFALLIDPSLLDLGEAVIAGAQLASLVWLYRSPWFAWQRTRPEGGPSIAPLMLLAVLVGVAGGLLGTEGAGVSVDVEV